VNRGAIHSLDAYVQGKMLDSSSWNGRLPRRITPSDIDHVFDNSGRMIFVEFSRDLRKQVWADCERGQRMVYEELVTQGNGNHIATLCFHDVPVTQQVDTRTDIRTFHVMYFNCHLRDVRYSDLLSGDLWEWLVLRWFESPETILNAMTEDYQNKLFDEVKK